MDTFRGHTVSQCTLRLAGIELDLIVPADPDALMDAASTETRFAENEYLPYWAQIWPAAIMLIEELAEWPDDAAAETRVLELGCGLGIVSLFLAVRGHPVLATDYDEDSLAFVLENARRNAIPGVQTRCVDWNEPLSEPPFPCIVAADVLYETRFLRPVAEFIQAHLQPAGVAVIADFNRSTANDFPTVARHCGLDVAVKAVETTHPLEGRTIAGRIFTLRHKAEDNGQ